MAPHVSLEQQTVLRSLLQRLETTSDGAGPSNSPMHPQVAALQDLQHWLRAELARSQDRADFVGRSLGRNGHHVQVCDDPAPVPDVPVPPQNLQQSANRFSPRLGLDPRMVPQMGARLSDTFASARFSEPPASVSRSDNSVVAHDRIRVIRSTYKAGDFVRVPHDLAPYFATWQQPDIPTNCTYFATFHNTFDGKCIAQPCAQSTDEDGTLHHIPYTLVWHDDDMPHTILGAKISADE